MNSENNSFGDYKGGFCDMLTITKLKMWKNPGYTRQCQDVPPVASKKLPTPDWVSSENLRPRKNSTLSAVELPLSYLEVFDMSYLYMEIEDGATPTPHTTSIFGWILSVEEIASSNQAVKIAWTPDYWRTYSDRAVFGSGIITRCDDSSHKRPYPLSPRFWKIKHYERLMTMRLDPTWYNPTYPYHVCISYNMNVGTKTVTTTIYWACNRDNGAPIHNVDDNTDYKTMSLTQVYAGLCDEILGLKTTAINSIYISPVQPYTVMPSVSGGGLLVPLEYKGDKYTAFIKKEGYTNSASLVIYNNDYETDDMKKAVIIDPYGSPICMIPWGMKVNYGHVGVDAGTTMCNLMGNFTYYADGTPPESAINNLIGGRVMCAPLINAPINSNAYGDYVLSGQMDYDKKTKELQRQEQKANGYASSGASAVGGAVTGGVATGNPIGAVGGALIGEVGSIVGTEVKYELAGKFNDAYQKLTNGLYSNQASTLIQSAGGDLFVVDDISVKDWYIVQLEADDVSEEEYSKDVSLNGYDVEIPTDDTSSYITNGGAVRITNLILTGAIPPEAKTNIKNILSNGVRIIENNPSGVVP